MNSKKSTVNKPNILHKLDVSMLRGKDTFKTDLPETDTESGTLFIVIGLGMIAASRVLKRFRKEKDN